LIVSDFLLFTVFGILFCMESVLLSGKGTVIIYSHLLKKWEFTISKNLPFFGGRHLSLKTLIPPIGAAFVTGSSPVIISTSGFMLNPCEGRYKTGAENSYQYSEIQSVGVSGPVLLVNEKNFCRMNSDSEALWWKEKIISLIKTAPDEREKRVDEFIASMFDLENIRKITQNIFVSVKPLRFTVNILYLFLFIAAPLAVFIFNPDDVLLPVLIVILMLHAAAVCFFYRAYRKVFTGRGIPWTVIISIALYPPALIRSIDYFFKDSLLQFNASVAAIALMEPENSKKLISYLIREYIYFRFESEDSFEKDMAVSYNRNLINGIKSLLTKTSINYEDLLKPPPPYDNTCLYCPGCFSQFIKDVKICEDCSIELKKYYSSLLND